MLTQVYEIGSPEEVSAISEIGIDHIGVLIGDGEFPRELPVEAATKVASGIIPPSKFSALFLTPDISQIEGMGTGTSAYDCPPGRCTRIVFSG